MRRLRRTCFVLAVTFGLLALPTSAFAESDDEGHMSVREKESGLWEGRVRKAVERSPSRKDNPTSRVHSQPRKPTEPTRPKITERERIAQIVMCREATDGVCRGAPRDRSQRPEPSDKPTLNLSAIARTLVTRLQLPDPTPQIGPDPEVNEWKMVAVGYPLWLWTDGPRTVTSRVQAHGVTFTLRATWLSTDFAMGDGHSVSCTATAAYTEAVKAGAKSPSCGYTYLKSSLPEGNYTVAATTNWRINWSALGQSGSLTGSHTGTRSLPVGELNALVVG